MTTYRTADDVLEDLQFVAWKDGKEDSSIHQSDYVFRKAKEELLADILSLAKGCESNWGNGKDLIDPEDLVLALQQYFMGNGGDK